MKKEILKIAGVKSEKEFYKKYPTEEAFMAKHGGAFKKAKMGAAMVEKQLTQLTDYANPPQAEIGAYIGGEQSKYQPLNYTELYDKADYSVTGKNRQMRMQEANLAAQQAQAANAGKKGGLDFDSLIQSAGTLAQVAQAFEYGGAMRKAQVGVNISMPTDYSQADTDITQQFNKANNANVGGLGTGKGGFLNQVGGAAGAIPIVGDIIQGFQQINKARDERRQAKQSFELSKLAKQAEGLDPDIAQRKYVRPEDQAFGTQEMGQAYGAGTNFLAANGAMIGGNPTEIQNMYNPGDIYSDLGYEPLSDKIKQYRHGGKAQFGKSIKTGLGKLDASGIGSEQFSQAGNAVGSLFGGTGGTPNAGGQLGGTIGKTVGSFIPIPGAKQALEFVGSAVGSIFGAKRAKETARYQEGTQQNLQDVAFMQGTKDMQAQNAAYMEDGGWISHDWQPQVITTFGEYKLKDLLKPDETMDTLRAGGHLKLYTAPSEEAMSTERPDLAMGGQLKTTWGGRAKPISQNPNLPGTGETVLFEGQSHDNGGIGVKYGKNAHDSYTDYAEYGTEQTDADVEVEGGEPAVELPDTETGDTSLVVYGNMPIPSYGAAELGDPKVKGKKFKAYAIDLSKQEAKQNKIVEKGTKLINSIDGDNPFDLLKLNSGQAMVMGANEKLKGLGIQKQRLADIQNSILETAEEMGLESDALAKGKIKKAKASDMAKFGGKFTKAQVGIDQPKNDYGLKPWKGNKYGLGKKTASAYSGEEWENIAREMGFKGKGNLQFQKFLADNPNVLPYILKKHNELYGKDVIFDEKLGAAWQGGIDRYLNRVPMQENPIQRIGDIPVKAQEVPANVKVTPIGKKPSFLNALFSEAAPFLRPSDQEKFDYAQIIPEINALGTNQLVPVQAQTFQPLLEQPYTVSLQDQLNANQADFNALQRQLGYNPAAASALAAQKYAANTGILGQQLRINQELAMGAYNRNRGVLNDAALKNLAILDQQYQRQSQAKSATKAQAQVALSSIADKMAKHKLDNRTLGVYENMYNFRFGPKGRAYNVNAPYEFSTEAYASTDDLIPVKNAKGDITEYRVKNKETAKNGSLVKAIKNL